MIMPPQLATFLVLYNILLAAIAANLSYVVSASNGFSLKLVHRDSPYSPLYQQNLSTFQRLQRDYEISYSRASYFESLNQILVNNNSSCTTLSAQKAIHILFTYRLPLFTVEISLGTPAVKKTFLFDTGSHITWTQCVPCTKCFKQDSPLFDPAKSKSFKKMSRSNKFSRHFNCGLFRSSCSYSVRYHCGDESRGSASVETFTFAADTSGRVPQIIPGVVFGCASSNVGFVGFDSKVSGIVGMSKSPISLVRQLEKFTMNRFSYCIPTSERSKSKYSFVRFGQDATIRSTNVQSTPFLRKQPTMLYKLNLIDVSIAGKRLGLQRGTFSQGCNIDSGSAISLIKEEAYDVMIVEFVRYFTQFKNLHRIVGEKVPRDLCYSKGSTSFNNFPSMTFHFEGANLDVPSSSLFSIFGDFFCLEMAGSTNITILGSYQQQNVRFLYDIGRETLSFAKEDCSKDTT